MTKPDDDSAITGYYTLSTAGIDFLDVPQEKSKKLARYPQISAVLIGRLAVDTTAKGQGIGAALLHDALLRCLSLSEQLAFALVIVDALNYNAKAFYEKYGFSSLANTPLRLFLPLEAIRKSQS